VDVQDYTADSTENAARRDANIRAGMRFIKRSRLNIVKKRVGWFAPEKVD